MTKGAISLIGLPLVLLGGLSLAACGSKPPKSTTTTRTQSTTTDDTGDKTSSDTKETRTEQPDGSHTVHRSETTDKTLPPAGK